MKKKVFGETLKNIILVISYKDCFKIYNTSKCIYTSAALCLNTDELFYRFENMSFFSSKLQRKLTNIFWKSYVLASLTLATVLLTFNLTCYSRFCILCILYIGLVCELFWSSMEERNIYCARVHFGWFLRTLFYPFVFHYFLLTRSISLGAAETKHNH